MQKASVLHLHHFQMALVKKSWQIHSFILQVMGNIIPQLNQSAVKTLQQNLQYATLNQNPIFTYLKRN